VAAELNKRTSETFATSFAQLITSYLTMMKMYSEHGFSFFRKKKKRKKKTLTDDEHVVGCS
jgi:hypothetical protein